MQRVDGVYHELEQPVPEVAARVEDGDRGLGAAAALTSHNAAHRSASHAGLE